MPTQRPDPQEKCQELVNQLLLAEQGDAAAQNAVAAKLAQGYFIKRDDSGALYWYAQAIKQGYTHAKWNAGTMLVAGEGVDSSYVNLGMKLIEQAAACGDPSACRFLSQAYADGCYGIEQDLKASSMWEDRARRYKAFVEYGPPFDIESHGIELIKPDLGLSSADV